MSLSSGLSIQELVQNLTSKDLGKFDEVLAGISSQRTAASKAEWNIYNSIFFCMTVTTTIGEQVINQLRARKTKHTIEIIVNRYVVKK